MAPRMRTVLALPLCLVLFAVGCGGSSSETPPPLEPDPTSGRYTGPRVNSAQEDEAPTPAAPDNSDDERPAQPRAPGRSTWGTGKPAAAPAPTMTSPNAVPAASASPAKP